MQEKNENNFDNFDSLPTLGDKLRYMRRNKGFTQEGLGKKIGVKGTHISKWETNRSTPSRQYVIELSKLLGVPVDSLEKHIQEKPKDDVSLEKKLAEYGQRKEASQGMSDNELDLLISFLRDHAKSLLRGLDYLDEIEQRRRNRSDDS